MLTPIELVVPLNQGETNNKKYYSCDDSNDLDCRLALVGFLLHTCAANRPSMASHGAGVRVIFAPAPSVCSPAPCPYRPVPVRGD